MKTNFIWGTDIHLDVIEDEDNTGKNVSDWVAENLASKEGEAILLTGDISNGQHVIRHLKLIKEGTGKPIYFVFGNHDYWHVSIKELRKQIVSSDLIKDGIIWLGGTDYIPCGSNLALIGHDGWYDALNGDVSKSRFVMKDWFNTDEFGGNIHDIISTSRKLAAGSASHIEESCERAIEDGKKRIIILTHFPPFAEACLYRGTRSNDNALPWYSSRLMGEALISLSEKHPDVLFTVFCGHTHSFIDISPRPNLRVVVGSSDYGFPNSAIIGVSE